MEEELVRFSPDDLDVMEEPELRNLLLKNDLQTDGDRQVLLLRFKRFLEQLEIEPSAGQTVQSHIAESKIKHYNLKDNLRTLREDLESAVRARDWTKAQVNMNRFEKKD